MADEAWAGLAEAIGAIRAELQQAARDGAGQEIQFRTGPVEIEFAVDVKKDGEARAKVPECLRVLGEDHPTTRIVRKNLLIVRG